MTQYQRQWYVRSSSRRDVQYTVSLTLDNEWQCSCPHWIYRRTDCKHIRNIRLGYHVAAPQPVRRQPQHELLLASVRQVTRRDSTNTIYVPMPPFGDIDFCATVVYDLVELGVEWQMVTMMGYLPDSWSADAVKNHVRAHGRKIFGEDLENFQVLPVN